MIRSFLLAFVITLGISFTTVMFLSKTDDRPKPTTKTWWEVQSVDTMKYSRDLSREKLYDPSFDLVIDAQVKSIADTGATHVAIGTPYDDEFIPMLTRWVKAARKHNLDVWFRGNFSGWEQWFKHQPISREEHRQKTITFIRAHPDLFADGDIFTACPECENGGPGDPRQTGDVDGFRLFMITERAAVASAFADIGKHVINNYNSMNYDVAMLIMDRATTSSMGGVVAIDHYVASPKQVATDIKLLAKSSGGRVFLGEFGAPIPDIHGNMNDTRQAEWLEETLYQLSMEPVLIGLNYWVNVGGSTELWYDEKTPKLAVSSLVKYYKPKQITGKVFDQHDKPITNVNVTTLHKSTKTDRSGQFSISVLPSDKNIFVHGTNYADMETQITDTSEQMKIIIRKTDRSIITMILGYFNNLFK